MSGTAKSSSFAGIVKAPVQSVESVFDRVKTTLQDGLVLASFPAAAPERASRGKEDDCRNGEGSSSSQKQKEEEPCPQLDETFSSDVTLRSSLGGGTEICMIGDDHVQKDEESQLITHTKTSGRAMSLKILRAFDLSIENPSCQVSLNEKVVGETPAREGTSDPVWGGPASSFHVTGHEDEQISLKIFENNSKGNVAAACVSFLVSDVLSHPCGKGNPNRWWKLRHSDDSAGDDDAGWVEVCLVPSQRAFLQAQPSAPIITAGPELFAGRRHQPMDSYAIRKDVMGSVTPVTLHVYDVSNDERVANVNYYTKALGAGGIFHAAVEAYGREYSFGGSTANVTGVFASRPKRCPMHHYRESVFLGDCMLSENQVHAILDDLKPKWMARSYNLFRKNCCFFSMELAIELGVGQIPEWVYSLAQTGEFIEPYLVQYAKRQNAKAHDQRKARRGTVVEKVEATPVSPPDRMVDHAMAARVQRSFRDRQTKKIRRESLTETR